MNPSWWGADASVQLQLSIVPHGDPSFLTAYSAGPIFNATYDTSKPLPSTTSSGSPSIAQRVKNIWARLSSGDVAAAVILPLLTVAGIIIFFYVRQQRAKRDLKTKRFSKAIDQRMSTISTDWRSTSGAGANAAVRNSMAVRNSTFEDRPASMYNAAGIGALSTQEEPVPQMEEMRRARQSIFANERGSRVISFAADTRDSYAEKENPRLPSAVRGLNARSFHQGQSAEDLTLSPTQTAGAELLHPGDIPQRASTEADVDFQREVLQMPAMTLMRTGHDHSENGLGEFIIPAHEQPQSILQQRGTPSPHGTFDYPAPLTMPTPALNLKSPNGMNGGMPMLSPGVATPPAGPAMSPDALLRAYANGGTRSMPSPAPSSNNGGMRILYQNEPTTPHAQYAQYPASVAPSSLAPGDNNPFRKSMAASRQSAYTESHYSGAYEDDEAAYEDGTEHYAAHGHAQ